MEQSDNVERKSDSLTLLKKSHDLINPKYQFGFWYKYVYIGTINIHLQFI